MINITSVTPSGSSAAIVGTGTPGEVAGVMLNGLLLTNRATVDGSGNWGFTITGLAVADYVVQGASVIETSTGVTIQVSAPTFVIGTPVGQVIQDTTPLVAGTFENINGAPSNGYQANISYRVKGSSTWILDGSTTVANGAYSYEIKTSLNDATYEILVQILAVTLNSPIKEITISKPDEAPIVADATDKLFVDSFDNVLIPINPPSGYVVFNAETLNVAKPGATWTITAGGTGLSMTGNVCTVSDPSQFAAAGTRSITLQASNYVGSDDTTFNLVVVATSASIRYYDSVAGLNTNAGDLPSVPKQTLASVGATTKRLKRGSTFAEIMACADNQAREDYGDPFADRPIIGVGQTHGVNGSDLDNATVKGIEARDTTQRGFLYQVYSNCIVQDCKVVSPATSNSAAYKFHNSNAGIKPPALTVPDLPGRLFSLLFLNNEAENTHGDTLYITKSKGVLIQNNSFDAAFGGGADCCQIAYENDPTQVSKEVLIRGNAFLQKPASQSDKGGLVAEGTEGYQVEYNYIGGKNFAFSSIGYDAVVRSNVMQYGRLNPYSFGCGTGEQLHLGRHKVYDNIVNDCNRGISLSGFGDSNVVNDGVYGYQRYDMDIHDNVIMKCTHAFFADRPWSGKVKRNIFMQCTNSITRQGGTVSGNTVANLGVETTQDVTGNFTNDGTFLSLVPPVMTGTMAAGGVMSVSLGSWTTTPDEVSYFWRDKDGKDFATGNGGSSFVIPSDAAADFELSCVVLARKGTNYMLAVAEANWPTSAYFIPRAWRMGLLPWKKRYFKLGDVA